MGSLCPPARLPSTPVLAPESPETPLRPAYTPVLGHSQALAHPGVRSVPAAPRTSSGLPWVVCSRPAPLDSSAAPQLPAARLRPAPPPRSRRPRPHPGPATQSPPFSRGPHCAPHPAYLVPRLSGSPTPPESPARPSGLHAPTPPARSRRPSPTRARRPAPPSRSRTAGALGQPPRHPPQIPPQRPATPRAPHLLRAPAASRPAGAGKAPRPAARDWPLAGSPAPPPLGLPGAGPPPPSRSPRPPRLSCCRQKAADGPRPPSVPAPRPCPLRPPPRGVREPVVSRFGRLTFTQPAPE